MQKSVRWQGVLHVGIVLIGLLMFNRTAFLCRREITVAAGWALITHH